MLFHFDAFPTLSTERLTLRRMTHDDAESIMALFGAPEVLRYLNQPPITTREKAVEMIDWLNRDYENHEGVDWGIALWGEARLIGMCGVYDWDRSNRHADIGYHIVPDQWGHGYATEATRAMLGWCFEALDLHRIQADCTDGNLASERVMLKCGFHFEGLWRESCWEHGRFVDIKQFGLLRQEFERA